MLGLSIAARNLNYVFMAHVPAIVRQYLFFLPCSEMSQAELSLGDFYGHTCPRFLSASGVLVIMHRNISDSSLKQLF